jgi:hypothetical protein
MELSEDYQGDNLLSHDKTLSPYPGCPGVNLKIDS